MNRTLQHKINLSSSIPAPSPRAIHLPPKAPLISVGQLEELITIDRRTSETLEKIKSLGAEASKIKTVQSSTLELVRSLKFWSYSSIAILVLLVAIGMYFIIMVSDINQSAQTENRLTSQRLKSIEADTRNIGYQLKELTVPIVQSSAKSPEKKSTASAAAKGGTP